ncbi:MAG TPA: cytochrome c peroxidase [Gemmataceae bacterium]|jgi:cytochrome c peroxidase|nr:cytochrome c peroxidase [Gemmataceae bacterium]
MPRAVLAALPLVCCLAAVPAAAPPAVPEDTLPERLPLDTIPLGLPAARPVPKDNPLTEAKVRLGRRLFFDPLLSGDGSVSCASCHRPDHGFAGPEPRAVGAGGRRGTRNAPSLLNRAFGGAFFWDGRAATLEEQALHPIESPVEMGSTVADALKRLGAHKEYPAAFRAAFGDGVSAANLARALASFERVLLAGDSRVDRFRAGKFAALNDSERQGLWLFESRGRCWRCHSGQTFSDEGYHNTGVGWGGAPADLGRHNVTRAEADRGRFKTPSLRAVARTAPYMHDGSLATLEEVVEYYNRGGNKNPRLDPLMRPLGLSKRDVADLVAFLKGLSE